MRRAAHNVLSSTFGEPSATGPRVEVDQSYAGHQQRDCVCDDVFTPERTQRETRCNPQARVLVDSHGPLAPSRLKTSRQYGKEFAALRAEKDAMKSEMESEMSHWRRKLSTAINEGGKWKLAAMDCASAVGATLSSSSDPLAVSDSVRARWQQTKKPRIPRSQEIMPPSENNIAAVVWSGAQRMSMRRRSLSNQEVFTVTLWPIVCLFV